MTNIRSCLLNTEQANEDKRARILQATGHLLASEGLHGLSMSKLAKAAGVANGTLYLYFADKQDLIHQYQYEVHKAIASHLLRDHNPALPLKEQYRICWGNMVDFMMSWPDFFTTQTQMLASPDYDSQMHKENMKTLFAPLRQMFQHGIDQGVFRDLPIELLTVMSLEVSITLARRHQLGLLELTPELSDLSCEQTWQAILKHHDS